MLNTYAVMDMAPSQSSDADSGLPSDLADMLSERLLPLTEDMLQQSSAALELSAQLRAVHSDGTKRRSMDASMLGAAMGEAEGGILGGVSVYRTEVSAVPIFMHRCAPACVCARRCAALRCAVCSAPRTELDVRVCSAESDIDVTRLLQKVVYLPTRTAALRTTHNALC